MSLVVLGIDGGDKGDCRGRDIVVLDGGVAVEPRADDCGSAPIALDVHLEDDGVVHEAVDRGDRHGLVGENLIPRPEGGIGGDEQAAPFVAGGNGVVPGGRCAS